MEDFDIGPLTWVKDEIDLALKNVLDSLSALESKPDDVASLKFSQTHLYQVSGALDMVGLEGCKRFCAAIEGLANKLEKQVIPVTPEVIALLRVSVAQLDEYLKELLNGAPDQPLKLFPALQSLLALQGEAADESELFFPDTSLRAPKGEAGEIPEADIPDYVIQQRSLFQKSLLGWLRTRSEEGLQGMLTALDNVQQVKQQAAQKTLWWSAAAFVESLSQEKIAEKRNVMKLCRRLDQQLRAFGRGTNRASGTLLRDMLFYVAISDASTDRIGQVKALFELEDLLPGHEHTATAGIEIEAGELETAVQLADAMDAFKDMWSAVSEGKADALSEFLGRSAEMTTASQALANTAISSLFASVQSLASALVDGSRQVDEHSIIEVAAGLNVLEDALRSYHGISRETGQQLVNQAQRINSILHGADEHAPTIAVTDEDLGQDVLAAMIPQIKDALKVTEQTLDTFFRNPAQHAILESVFKPLQQVAAAFDMLNMQLPTDIAKSSLSLVEYFHAGNDAAEQSQFELVAESLSMLDLFVDELPRTRPESEAALASALSRLQAQLSALADPAAPGEAAASDDAQEAAAAAPAEAATLTDSAADAELLDIYLTEAEEVLATVAQNLQALRVNATDPEALVEVRRGYHTLKGSGRAVGLNTVGEVAWTVEKLLNDVMEQKLTPSADMIGFTEDVSADFAGWVAQLRNGATVEVDLPSWQEKAAALQAGISKRKPRAVEEVVIGGTHKISRALFSIFMAEAQEHMQALNQSVPHVVAAAITGGSLKPDDASRRAAHTLASNAGTAGFKAICNLSRALEHWLDVHQGNWTEQSAALYENVVKALGNMLEKAALLRQPKQVTALLTALKEATLNARTTGAVDDGNLEPEDLPLAGIEVDAATLDVATTDTGVAEPALPEAELSDIPEAELLEPQDANEEPSIAEVAQDAELSVEEPVVDADLPIEAIVIKKAIKQAAKPDMADNELLNMFIEEARELVPTVGNELRAWRQDPFESEHPDELQRALHTLKGSARMAGQSALADTVHDMEDRVMRGLKTKSKEIDFDGLFLNLDEIGGQLEEAVNFVLKAGQPEVAKPGRTVERTQYLRMRAEVLDRLINEAGEISIARSRMDREMQGFKQFSLDLTESVFRLRNQLREMEIEAESQLQSRMAFLQETNETFDPLEFDRFTRLQELTRMMAESVNDVSTIQHGLLMNLDETESALQQQNRMNRELQHGLMNVRMVPFSMIAERLQRIIRQTSRELNKAVEMSIDGENVDIDRSVLDKIVAPLEHLLRNSVAHGMETRAERKKAKKPETGAVSLKVRRENDEIIITVSDDGAGINLAKVKKKAIENGLFEKGQNISDQALLQVIFESGFSTATTVTQIAGRGVGLDSVRTDITALGGRIDVSNSAGQGAVFNIYLPVTLSVAQVVVVRAGSNTFALPSVMVEQVQNLKPAELTAGYETKSITWSGRQYPLLYLNRLVGNVEHAPEAQLYSPLLLLRSGTYQIALHVDEILGNQEVVMKPIGPQLAHVPGMIGATVMGDGNVVLILNAVLLANREELSAGTVKVSSSPMAAVAEVEATTILVVDDSLTMRKVLGRLLEREGYRVVIAKDGMDALQVLQELSPDIILTDIEMPRMDGFELLRNIRGDARIAGIPVIIISSRTAEKHRNLAQELGVNAFLGKPVQDDELITQISVLLGRAEPVSTLPV
ncbi:MAG: Hpt domain-containing protein [Pseudomonadota bacterium]